MAGLFEEFCRFVGAVLAICALGFVLSFLGCDDSSTSMGPPPDFSYQFDSPALSDPLPSFSIDVLPPPPDLQP